MILSEEVPVVLKRANTVDAADNAAKEAAAKAENELLPWVREQRERLQGQLKDVQAMALHAGGHHVGHAPSTAAGLGYLGPNNNTPRVFSRKGRGPRVLVLFRSGLRPFLPATCPRAGVTFSG